MASASTILQQRDNGGSYLTERGCHGLVISVVFTALATCFVAARFYTRTRIIKHTEPNDWMVLIALTFSYVFMGLFIAESLNGMGMSGAKIPPGVLAQQMKAFWLTIPFYNAALFCAKATILMQYFRVFATKGIRIASTIMLIVLAIYGTWAVLIAFLNCIPVEKFWHPSTPGHCLSEKGLWFSNAAMHISTDIAIFLIPIPALLKLPLPKRQKIAIIAMFALGGFGCVTSICRLVSLKTIADSNDPTYDNVGAALWSAIECNVGIICACLPTLRPLVSRIFPCMALSYKPGDNSYNMSRRRTPTYSNRSATPNATPDDVENGLVITDTKKLLAQIYRNYGDGGGQNDSKGGNGMEETTR
ncbi:integral membrane protein [Aspergillus sclerotialis]|uniref:Integral membrane protein n=1 Tax=Aspergillus sclerotialis TaxID=2070753 RepID=A0A3A3A4Q9_9EURO|nr:integral membrane protein [Aspergillus sclerotialis]